jgi:hypothetical protein
MIGTETITIVSDVGVLALASLIVVLVVAGITIIATWSMICVSARDVSSRAVILAVIHIGVVSVAI